MAKRLRRQEVKRRKIITGRGYNNSGGFKGAPEPNRELFIYRVDKQTTLRDLRVHVLDEGFDVRALECISNPNSKFKSFKLSVPVSQFSHLFDESIWPIGVRVRKYVPPNHADHNIGV